MSSPSSSSSSTTVSPSASSTATPSHDTRPMMTGIILGIVGVIVIAGIIYMTLRLKNRKANTLEFSPRASQGRMLDRQHPAAHITPFGSPGGEGPRFMHTPGANMRIASRRPDGVWDFQDPRAPFTPSGISELEFMPSPSSSSAMLPYPRSAGYKEKSDTKSQLDGKGFFDYEPSADVLPPPAYVYGHDHGESQGYLRQSPV